MDDTTKKWDPAKLGYRVGFALVGVLVLATAILIPVGIRDLWHTLHNRSTEAFILVAPPPDAPTPDDYTLAYVEITALDEVKQLASMRVSGYHACDQQCDYKDKLSFFSLYSDDTGTEELPISESLTVTANGTESSAKFDLPFSSDLLRYPFDHSVIILGVKVERTGADGKAVPLSPEYVHSHVAIAIVDQIARVQMMKPRPVDPAVVRPTRVKAFDYDAVNVVSFERPAYLKILVVLIVLLIATAAAYAALLRPFDQLIINAGALVLGVWGVRSLVLGSYPPDTTAVDIVLTVVAFFLLCTIAVRGLNYMHLQSGFRLPGLAHAKTEPKTTRPCPECESEISRTARRCPFCTAVVPPEPDETAEQAEPSGETDETAERAPIPAALSERR